MMVPKESLIGIRNPKIMTSSNDSVNSASNQEINKSTNTTMSGSHFVRFLPELDITPPSQSNTTTSQNINCISSSKSKVKYVNQKSHPCIICHTIFPSPTKLHYHLLTVHSDERPYSCEICSKSFQLPFEVKNHMVVHLNQTEKPNQDLISSNTAVSQPAIIAVPEPKVSAMTPKLMELCDVSMSGSKPHLEAKETKIRIVNGWHYCSKCGKGFPGRSKLVRHLKVCGVEQTFCCDKCLKSFQSLKRFEKHKEVHEKENPTSHQEKSLITEHSCAVCQKKFQNKTKLNLHMATTHSDEKPFVCDICAKSFKVLWLLNTHIKVMHSGEFKCEQCQAPFKSKRLLLEHKRAAHLIRFCGICSKNFKNEAECKKHIQEVHQGSKVIVKSHACEVCGLSFQFNCQLKYHMVVHDKSSSSKFVCDVCGIVLCSRTSLKHHKQRHDGIKPFQCDICGKAFISKPKLKFHARTHTGERPYSCEVCKKTFTQRTTLVIHMRLHTGERPYTCELCQKGFVSRCLMNTHKKKKHQLD